MRNSSSRWLLRFSIGIFFLGFIFNFSTHADGKSRLILLRNAVVDQGLGSSSPKPVSVLIRGERIWKIGDEVRLRSLGVIDQEFDLKGKWLTHSFHDNHIHPIDSGVDLLECPLDEAENLQALLLRLKRCDEQLPSEAAWLRASGWTSFLFPSGEGPRTELLDSLGLRHPVAIVSGDGHSYWVDSKAMRLAQINSSTPSPKGGEIVRDSNGKPTGVFREEAMRLIDSVLPKRHANELKRGLALAIRLMHQVGITSFKDAYVTEESLEIYRQMEKEGALPVDVTACLYVDPSKGLDQLKLFQSLRRQYESGRIHVSTVKIFLDGVLEDQTAALKEPYVGSTQRGLLHWNELQLGQMVAAADQLGFQVHFHAIGDRAVTAALDAVAFARNVNGESHLAHEIAHLQVIDPADRPRFAQLNVNAVFSPAWAVRDESIRDFAEPLLGPERSKWLYSIGSVLRAGGRLAFGSDWAVTSVNPLEGIQVAVTRLPIEARKRESQNPWLPNERISVREALAGYQREESRGGLVEGQRADLVILDQNPYRVPTSEIAKIQVLKTFFRGDAIDSLSLHP